MVLENKKIHLKLSGRLRGTIPILLCLSIALEYSLAYSLNPRFVQHTRRLLVFCRHCRPHRHHHRATGACGTAAGVTPTPTPTTMTPPRGGQTTTPPRLVVVEEDSTTTITTRMNTKQEQQQQEEKEKQVNGGRVASSQEDTTTVGPDLNESRSPLDHKLYRQILLPNGLWCVLVQDTVAMHQQQHEGPLPLDTEALDDDDDVEGDDDDDDDEEDDKRQESRHGKKKLKGDDDSDNDDDDDDESDDKGGIRDAAAALLVGVGSAYDPLECQGMAHFLEHLLFLGSQKYPGENDFGAFVSKHGGSENAWTDFESTVYHLSIPQEYLWPALDRLVQHFVSPLLSESSVDRELNAIESEFQLNKPSDECRRLQLHAATGKPNHVFANFGWGNLRSLRHVPQDLLGIDTLTELRHFFERYYYAANMRLVVMGAYPLDHLQRRVQELFRDVPPLPRRDNTRFPTLPIQPERITSWDTLNVDYDSPLRLQGMPWDDERALQKLFRIVPTKDRHRLTLTWPIPSQNSKWKGKPYDFIAHLLGHEGVGSLYSYFRNQSWASGCVAGMRDDEQASSAWLFSFAINLTEQGLREWKSMVHAVYHYLGLLRRYSKRRGTTTTNNDSSATSKSDWPEWIHEELKQMEEVSYKYSDEEDPEDLVSNLVENMAPHLRLPPERILDGNDLLWEFDQEGIHELLMQYLTPINMRVDLTSSTFGKYADLEHVLMAAADPNSTDFIIRKLRVHNEQEQQQHQNIGKDDNTTAVFDPTLWEPQVEPNFETIFWCSEIPAEWIAEWNQVLLDEPPPYDPATPSSSSSSLPLHLPPPNPFVPTRLDLKELPHGDSHHALLNATIKVCSLGQKKKQWYPATVVQYDRKTNHIKLCYEDDEEQWHVRDDASAAKELKPEILTPDYEGTLDQKQTKFRIVSLALAGVTRRFGDETTPDLDRSFPPLPPVLPLHRLPKELSSSNILRLWHLQDREFHRPVAELRLQVACAKANASPLHRACSELCMDLLWDACLECVTYPASCAELSSSVEATDSGFGFRFHGFDDKLLVLFQQTFQVFLSFRNQQMGGSLLPPGISDRRFEACLEVLRRKYTNTGTDVSSYCSTLRLEAMRLRKWSSHQKKQAVADLTISQFGQTMTEILECFAIECLMHGNLSTDDAKRAKDLILSMVTSSSSSSPAGESTPPGLKRQKYPPLSMLKLPAVSEHLRITVPSKNALECNTCVEVYIQVGKDSLWDRVLIDVLVQIMDDPIFTQLRTKDAFGYEVYCDARWSYGITGFIFRVVSNVKSAEEIIERIDRFLLDFRDQELANLTQDELVEYLVGLSKQKLDSTYIDHPSIQHSIRIMCVPVPYLLF